MSCHYNCDGDKEGGKQGFLNQENIVGGVSLGGRLPSVPDDDDDDDDDDDCGCGDDDNDDYDDHDDDDDDDDDKDEDDEHNREIKIHVYSIRQTANVS